MLTNNRRTDTFVSILADGLLHVTANEETEGAVKRTYETKERDSDGNFIKKSKWELQYTELTGMISGIKFYEGDYGLQLQVTFTDDTDKPITLSVNTQSNFGEDIMKKLPNIDLKQPVKLVPYSFKDEKTGKPRRGVTIYQGEEKIQSFYYDAEKKKTLHGYPVAKLPKVKKGEKVPTSFWKLFYLQANAFLVEDIKKRMNITEDAAEGDKELDDLVADAQSALDDK